MSVLYRLLTRLVRLLAPLFARSGSKLHLGLAGRASAHEDLALWGRGRRDRGRPLVWFHAPSVGEGLQAKAVIDALRARRGEVQVAFTHFSPSAEALASRIGADVAAYLPWDLPETVGEALDGLRPDLLVFTKTEVWPVLASAARAGGVRVCLIGGSVPDGAGRAKWPARALLRSTWRGLSLACANTEADAGRLTALGADPSVVHTTGDPGIDSAAQRADAADRDAPYLAPFLASPAPTLVAGSTWPAGEAVLLPAMRALRETVDRLRVVVAPHEPSASHVEALRERLTADGWRPTALSAIEASGLVGEHDAIIVDSVGILAQLYTMGDVAYVGGGFGNKGLHSVLEPAAAGLPVSFGPNHGDARAAAELVKTGGAKIASDTEEMERTLSEWFADEAGRSAAGRQAFGYIDDHRGAAARTAELLESLI